MANEAVIISLPNNINAVRRTISGGHAIPKGTILKLADPNTVSPSTGTGDIFGGIAASETGVATGDTATTNIGAWMTGVFDLVVEGGVTAGTFVTSSGANLIRDATEAEVNAGQFIGTAEETAATATTEAVRVRLRGGI